jgi:long-chain acyl-CoA synthetase
MNISKIITDNAIFHPNYKAIISGDDFRELTWSELNTKINQLGNSLLHLGVKKGDIVAIYMPNSPEFIIAFFALAKIGAVILPFNSLYKRIESAYILNNSQARFLIGSTDLIKKYILPFKQDIPALEIIIGAGATDSNIYDFNKLLEDGSPYLDAVECREDDLFILMYTSGTTGYPKGAMLTCGNINSVARLNAGLTNINDLDLLLSPAPYCHIFYVLSVLAPFYAGAGIVTVKQFHPHQILGLISDYKVTHFAGVPAMIILMLQKLQLNSYDLTSLRHVFSAGVSMPEEHIQAVEEKMGAFFDELYGLTETSSTVTYIRTGHPRNGSVGLVGRNIEVRIVDEKSRQIPSGSVGEILVKSPGVFKGYYNMPEKTAESFLDSWFRTGDVGRFDEDGFLYILGRKKDIIVTGGYNVYPREIEELLYHHPKIEEVAIIGVKDPVLSEVPKAYISLKSGEQLSSEDIISYCKNELASYKVPHYVEFMPALPKGPTGKINKRLLKEESKKSPQD